MTNISTPDYTQMSPQTLTEEADRTIGLIEVKASSLGQSCPPIERPLRSSESPTGDPPTRFLKRVAGELLSQVNLDELTPDKLVTIFRTIHERSKTEETNRAKFAANELHKLMSC